MVFIIVIFNFIQNLNILNTFNTTLLGIKLSSQITGHYFVIILYIYIFYLLYFFTKLKRVHIYVYFFRTVFYDTTILILINLVLILKTFVIVRYRVCIYFDNLFIYNLFLTVNGWLQDN